MKKYLDIDPWVIRETGFHFNRNRVSESIFSLGNGKIGQRANFCEYFSGDSLQGSYISGVYYPDKTKVGWWKNGYPEYFAKVLNAPYWNGVRCKINGEKLDLASVEIQDFQRELNMQEGYYRYSYSAVLQNGKRMSIECKRILSISRDELALIEYSITAIDSDLELEILLDVDGDVMNADSNYDEKFWIGSEQNLDPLYVLAKTKKTGFEVCTMMKPQFFHSKKEIYLKYEEIDRKKYVGKNYKYILTKESNLRIVKFVAVTNSMNHASDQLIAAAEKLMDIAVTLGSSALIEEQKQAWREKWVDGDIRISGDEEAQQGIRFNIFQMHQTYTGKDSRLNIGPKGFTGEKYGGSTYWDTEAYCLPFYLSTADESVSRNLLLYRYKHLGKAIENATKLGFKDGAALYPMVTMNGEECHNEWEITFEEIHRNGAIAYAIYNYTRYTGNKNYIAEHGIDVLVAISRFWIQRLNFSKAKNAFVMLGVTGPNEYENNVNNNWYTNYIAQWTIKYTLECLESLETAHKKTFKDKVQSLKIKTEELRSWSSTAEQIYFPEDAERGIFLQQDGFLDKDLKPAEEIPKEERPIHENWSWDRILRSPYIKQADVLQGLWFFEDHFDIATIKRNYDYYEPFTVHESSLSPSVHSILAARLKDEERAYKFYLSSSRLDLDDYNNDTCDGLHITSMGGTWMTVVYGFAGMRVKNDTLSFRPLLPKAWDSFGFKLKYRKWNLEVDFHKDQFELKNNTAEDFYFELNDKKHEVEADSAKAFKL